MREDKRKKLAELERLSREQDEAAFLRDREHAGRAQLLVLRATLIRLGLFDTEKAQGNWRYDPETGEVRAWWVIDGFAYADHEGCVYVEHKVNGVYEWAVIEEGKPIQWLSERRPGRNLN